MNAVKLSKKYTTEELVRMEREATKAGKLKNATEIRWAITYQLAEKRELQGDPVSQNGYTGPKQKRR